MKALSRLEDMRVVAKDGELLGRVFELRSPGRAETEPTYRERRVDHLVCGRLGLLERLGWREPAALAIPWSHVTAIEGRTLRVQGTRGDYSNAGRP